MSGVEAMSLRGVLAGHNGWVTSIAVPSNVADVVISASRDKSIIVWNIVAGATPEEYGVAKKRYEGHGHYIQDIACTADGQYVISGAWDNSLRLWDLKKDSSKRFVGHTRDVLSVAFSDDNRHIASGSRDKSVKLWNTLGKCKFTFGPEQNGHKEWVSCVRFTPSYDKAAPTLISAGWDKLVKIWTLADVAQGVRLRSNLVGHSSYINALTVAPDGSLCASGGKDGKAMLWDLNQGTHLSALDADDSINALIFSPSRFWLCAATASRIVIWDLESKVIMDQIRLEEKTKTKNDLKGKTVPIQCISLAWSADGNILYAGYTDNVIRAYGISRQ